MQSTGSASIRHAAFIDHWLMNVPHSDTRVSSSCRLPQRADGHGIQAVAESGAHFSVVQRDVVADRGAAKLEGARQVADVDQPGCLAGGERQQPGQRIERGDARQVADIALDQRLDVVAIPEPRRRALGRASAAG